MSEISIFDDLNDALYPYELVPVVSVEWDVLPIEGTLTEWWISVGYKKYLYR